jgi:hypothetical protein
MPSIYKGSYAGISVMFAGLNEENYNSLELSIDGEHFFTVSRDVSDSFYSEHYVFDNLLEGKIYTVIGRINNNTQINCNFVASRYIKEDNIEFIAKLSGGASMLPQSPKGELINGIS